MSTKSSYRTWSREWLGNIIVSGLLILATVAYGNEPRENSDLVGDFESSLDAIVSLVQSSDADHALLAQHIDFPAITRGVLAEHGKQLSPAQVARFQGVFEQSMFTLLQSATKAVGDFEIEVTQTKISEKHQDRGQAYADILPERGKAISIIASMSQQAAGWKVRNLIVDGVNLGLTYRNQFDQLMQQHAGNAEQAIDAWAASTTAPPDS